MCRDLKLDNTLLDGRDPPWLKLCDVSGQGAPAGGGRGRGEAKRRGRGGGRGCDAAVPCCCNPAKTPHRPRPSPQLLPPDGARAARPSIQFCDRARQFGFAKGWEAHSTSNMDTTRIGT